MTYSSASFAAICVAVTMLPLIAYAQDERAGQILANKLCARCHSIDKVNHSPLDKAPPFRVIANRYSVWSLQEAFAEGIVTGHADMPEFVLTPKEIGNLLTFMDSFTSSENK